GSSGRAADQVRTGHQPEDRQSARPHRATIAARPCRRGHRMTRVIVVLLLFAFLPHAAPEAAERVFRVASLARTEDSLQITRHMLQELASLGFREGDNLIVEEGAGDPSELAELVRTMLDRRPDAIVAVGGEAISAARQVTSTVPIVIFGGPNPVDMGY